jgi:methylamine dehydrogenase light chain
MMLHAFDRMMESASRHIAQRSSRRSVLARLGTALIGGALLPMLPVDRSGRMKLAHANEFARNAQTSDPTACNYWRYCSSDGYLCECCGGTYNVCPAGSYQDCCGKDSCGQCACLGTEGEMPTYRPELNNDIVWCFGAPSMVYHCSSQVVIGKA